LAEAGGVGLATGVASEPGAEASRLEMRPNSWVFVTSLAPSSGGLREG